MKDPEQMSKHELVQTIYKLAEVNQELVSVEEIEDIVATTSTTTRIGYSTLSRAIAKAIHALIKGKKENDTTKEA